MNRRKFLGLLAPLAVAPLVAKAIASSAPAKERGASPCDCPDAVACSCNPAGYSNWPPDYCAVTYHGIGKWQLLENDPSIDIGREIVAHYARRFQDQLDHQICYGNGLPAPRGIITC